MMRCVSKVQRTMTLRGVRTVSGALLSLASHACRIIPTGTEIDHTIQVSHQNLDARAAHCQSKSPTDVHPNAVPGQGYLLLCGAYLAFVTNASADFLIQFSNLF